MNFSSLTANEKLAVYGAVAAIVGVLIASFLSALTWFALLAGFGMLAVLFLPQLAPGTPLPGSKGSLMFLLGLIGGAAAVLALLGVVTQLGAYLEFWPIQTLFLLIASAGGLIMAWTGWQAFQADGGKFKLGTPGGAAPRATGTPVARTDQPPPSTPGTGASPIARPPTSAGSDMGSEGGPAARRDDEDIARP
jgi:hypothetical protein